MNKVTALITGVYVFAALLVLTISFNAQTVIPVLAPPPASATAPADEPTAWNQWAGQAHKTLELYTVAPGEETEETPVFPVKKVTKIKKALAMYDAADVFAPCGATVVAPFTGRVVATTNQNIWSQDTNHGPHRDGISVTLRTGTTHIMFAHLTEVSVSAGEEITAGTPIGTTGQSGNGNKIDCHTRVALSPSACNIDSWWIRRGAVDPVPFLKNWREGKIDHPSAATTTWLQENGCPTTE